MRGTGRQGTQVLPSPWWQPSLAPDVFCLGHSDRAYSLMIRRRQPAVSVKLESLKLKLRKESIPNRPKRRGILSFAGELFLGQTLHPSRRSRWCERLASMTRTKARYSDGTAWCRKTQLATDPQIESPWQIWKAVLSDRLRHHYRKPLRQRVWLRPRSIHWRCRGQGCSNPRTAARSCSMKRGNPPGFRLAFSGSQNNEVRPVDRQTHASSMSVSSRRQTRILLSAGFVGPALSGISLSTSRIGFYWWDIPEYIDGFLRSNGAAYRINRQRS